MTTTLDWFGCTTFRLCVDDTVIFLDAYIDRVPGADGPPGATAAGVASANWILVGHSHFDHIWGAETIAINTGATIIGSYETIRYMREAGVPEVQLIPISGGEHIPLGDGIVAHVFPALHSCWWAPYDDEHPNSPCFGAEELDYFVRAELMTENMAEAMRGLSKHADQHLSESINADGGDGGTFAYLIETPEGSLFFKDTPGHWSGIMKNITADVAVLGVSGRPHIDGSTHQGSLAEFVVTECNFLNARRFIPCHHDNYLPGFSRPFGSEELALNVTANTSAEFVELDYSGGYEVFKNLK